MEKIKFRGRDKSGEYHYGGIYKFDFDDGSSRCAIIEQIYENEIEKAVGIYYLSEIEVEPESVAQFVGYDADGNEVYEGDKVHGISGTMIGHTFTARRANVAQSTNGMYWGFLPEDVRKESGENENLS